MMASPGTGNGIPTSSRKRRENNARYSCCSTKRRILSVTLVYAVCDNHAGGIAGSMATTTDGEDAHASRRLGSSLTACHIEAQHEETEDEGGHPHQQPAGV